MKRIKSFDNTAILYVVATPVGNLKEISERAKEILNEVDYVAAEDSRVSGKLLAHLNIKKPLISCHEHNETVISKKIIDLIKEGNKIAYVSDAGMPGISDPGSILIKEAIDNNIVVCPVSGPTAFVDALVCSGLDSEHFYFFGFLDAKINVKKEEIKMLAKKKETLIFYEAPHRIDKTLACLFDILGDRKACIARELTKIHEEFIRGTLGELKEINKESLIGEMVIIVEGAPKELETFLDPNEIIKTVNCFQNAGLSTKDAIIKTSKLLNISKNKVYSIYHQN